MRYSINDFGFFYDIRYRFGIGGHSKAQLQLGVLVPSVTVPSPLPFDPSCTLELVVLAYDWQTLFVARR